MEKLYFYPCPGKKGYGNPYCSNYKNAMGKYYHVLNSLNKPQRLPTLALLRNSFSADVYVFNWLEDIGHTHFPFLQYCIVRLSLFVLQLRQASLVWMFHNIRPHHGENYYSRILRRYLFNKSKLIISHSEEGAEFAKKYSKRRVVYICHPVETRKYNVLDTSSTYDVFIWGDIFPYKGVVEFLREVKQRNVDNLKILILGRSKIDFLDTEISKYRSNTILYENRRAEIDEIATFCKCCKYVLFPYVGDSMSSSGALIETIAMGGTPLGPAKGAFEDLKKEGVCFTYDNYDDLFELLNKEMKIGDSERNDFIEANSWHHFADCFYNNLNNK